jgi:aminoglycoside phosphotransferase
MTVSAMDQEAPPFSKLPGKDLLQSGTEPLSDAVRAGLGKLKIARRLTGLSGAMVFLCSEDGRHFFVRKVAETADLSNRLRAQVAKQVWFAEHIEAVSTPRILATHEVDQVFWFDMEYVQGPDAVSYLRQVNYEEVRRFADRLKGYLREASSIAPGLAAPASTLFRELYAKICSIQAKTASIPAEVLARLFLALERLIPLETLSPTLCHGDLTLENMIVTHDGRVVALDMIPAPFEHFWHDIAKLHQDVAGGWYLRHHSPISQSVLDFLARNLLASGVEIHPAYGQVHYLLTAVVFARILPYADGPEMRDFVIARVDHFSRLAQGTWK